ncbi:hypothetical protein C0J52_10373, partial [Blattella germanica]
SSSSSFSIPSALQRRDCLYPLPPFFSVSSQSLQFSNPFPLFTRYIFNSIHISFPRSSSRSGSFHSCLHYLFRFPSLIHSLTTCPNHFSCLFSSFCSTDSYFRLSRILSFPSITFHFYCSNTSYVSSSY